MKIDARLDTSLTAVAGDVRAIEEIGFDGAWNTENRADPFLSLTLACEHSERLALGPSVAIAFARTPMTVAYPSWDLQRFSEGRLILGLGSQIRPHVARRFSMPWSEPADRMREFVLALRAIWRTWATGERLEHRGRFYEHTLMAPAFTPPANPSGPPPVFLAAVGPRMLRVAAEVADGLFVHPFCTEAYLRDVIVPEVTAHRPADAAPLQIALSPFVALDESDVEAVRRQISFYGSTPAYRRVLELHGQGDLQTELHRMSKEGRWDDMPALVDDDLLHAMCAVGSPGEAARTLRARYGGVADRLRLNRPGDTPPPPTHFAELVDLLRR
ncbi:TIGR03617 family F420-dependent LLM class oxidoreductase [Actinomycetospora soli]|uniref:TIGR03617 family F420-dependent LLM class oxidoreductase n=1 Tax=Actinomycetospora soli TaxID=2893887 RepID=UPI001E440ECD|nr:TIGR03617 family F420-dependent LLM class oxidoreductase [Actinomycetospora soli]MCD2190488.1 TIGR03617 family F420-dependent LLM class oxidoreductase [Actinomycetospora soli]